LKKMYANNPGVSYHSQPPYTADGYFTNDDMLGLANEMNQMSFEPIRNHRPQRRGNRGRNNRRNKRGRGGGRGGGRRNNNRGENNYHHNGGEMGYNQNYGFRQPTPVQFTDNSNTYSLFSGGVVHGIPHQMYTNAPTGMIPVGMNGAANMGGPSMYQQKYTNNVNYREDYVPEEEPQSIDEVKGRIYTLARTQAGCRILQKLLEKSPESFRLIFSELQEHFGTLVSDPFGHHLCLRLIDYIEEHEMREIVLTKLKEDLVAVSLSVHGTRVIQKLLEMMQTPLELQIVQDAMSMYVITLAKDVYGMHVILRCLHRIPPPSEDKTESGPSNQFIFEEITKNIVCVATHKHGCCVVQWCIDYATPKQRRKLVEVVVENSLELAQDAFGNYVVQQIMDVSKWKSNEDAKARRKVMQALLGNIPKLAVQKFSSIVVEKCLQEADEDIRLAMVEELVDPMRLPRLLQDPFANYVIQKVLSVSRSDEFQRLILRIRPHLDVLSHTPFGKRIQLQMFRKFPILSINNECSLEYMGEQVSPCFQPPQE